MPKNSRQKIVVLVGPTSSGKTSLSIRLAKKFNGEVISADSRQVYKGLNLGTGKVTKAEMEGVPHHVLDIANPKKRFSASDFKERADSAIESTAKQEKLPIVTGGTGFYIDILAGNIVLPKVPPNERLRLRLEKKNPETLFTELKKRDPKRAHTIEPTHKRRLIRALEIVYANGTVPKPTKAKDVKPRYDIVWIGIDEVDVKLKEKIYHRLKKRIQQGMIAEAKRLHAQGLTYKRMEELGLEYKYLARFLKGKLTRAEFEEQLANAIWKYVKRQRRWFKRNKDIEWFTPQEVRKIERRVEDFLDES